MRLRRSVLAFAGLIGSFAQTLAGDVPKECESLAITTYLCGLTEDRSDRAERCRQHVGYMAGYALAAGLAMSEQKKRGVCEKAARALRAEAERKIEQGEAVTTKEQIANIFSFSSAESGDRLTKLQRKTKLRSFEGLRFSYKFTVGEVEPAYTKWIWISSKPLKGFGGVSKYIICEYRRDAIDALKVSLGSEHTCSGVIKEVEDAGFFVNIIVSAGD